MPRELDAQTEWQTEFPRASYSWMNYIDSTHIGPPPRSKNGACSCWNASSITWLPCKRKSIEGAPKDQSWRWLSQPLNIPPCAGPFQDPLMKKSWRWQNKFTGENLLLCQVYYPPMIGLVHEGAVPRTCQMHGQGRSTEWGGIGRTLCKKWKMFPQSIHFMGPFLLIWTWGMEMAKKLKEDTPAGQSEARRCSHSRGRDWLRWHQSPSPQCPSRHLSPSPSPPQSHPATEQLSCSMEDLNLYMRIWEPRSRAWWSDAPTPTEKPKKQVRFDVEGELGNDPKLPPGLTLFIVEGLAEEEDDAPGPVPEESLQLPPSEGPQCWPSHTGGARLKAIAHPSPCWYQSWYQLKLEGPDPVKHPHRWIQEEIEKIGHPHWGEGPKTQWKVVNVVNGFPPDKEGPQQCQSPPTSPLAGGSIQAAPGPTWGFGVVGAPLDSAASTLRISYPLLMPSAQGTSAP